MNMRKAIAVVSELAARGVIKSYAITGAVAALAYVEPTTTHDLDVLVAVGDLETRQSGLILLAPIESALAGQGYTKRSDVGIVIEGWPVQFIPVASALDEECLREAVELEFGTVSAVRARVLRPEHIVAKAVSIGRIKDLARVEEFLDQGKVEVPALKAVIERHGLREAWISFCLKSGRSDLLGIG